MQCRTKVHKHINTQTHTPLTHTHTHSHPHMPTHTHDTQTESVHHNLRSHFVMCCTSWGRILILLQERSSSWRVGIVQMETGNFRRSLSERERETSRWKMARSLIQPIVRDWPRKWASVCSKCSWRQWIPPWEIIRFVHRYMIMRWFYNLLLIVSDSHSQYYNKTLWDSISGFSYTSWDTTGFLSIHLIPNPDTAIGYRLWESGFSYQHELPYMEMLWNKLYLYAHSEFGYFSHERKQWDTHKASCTL